MQPALELQAEHTMDFSTCLAEVVLGGLDTIHDPQRWRQSWWDDFCKSHPGFQYRTDLLTSLLSAAALRTGSVGGQLPVSS